jgi:hypothetical protein
LSTGVSESLTVSNQAARHRSPWPNLGRNSSDA